MVIRVLVRVLVREIALALRLVLVRVPEHMLMFLVVLMIGHGLVFICSLIRVVVAVVVRDQTRVQASFYLCVIQLLSIC